MSFVFGLVIGITVGLALIVGFVKSENARSKRRSDLVSKFFALSRQILFLLFFSGFMRCWFLKATAIAAFARMTVEDSRKILAPEYYPSWVVFSQRQKLSILSLYRCCYTVVNDSAKSCPGLSGFRLDSYSFDNGLHDTLLCPSLGASGVLAL